MLGAIIGDIVGSRYESRPVKSRDFPLFDDFSRFTDDTVLTIAVANALLKGTSYHDEIRHFSLQHRRAGYGGGFRKWMMATNPQPYNSYGNGSAMRVSPVGFMANSQEWALSEAKKTAEITHNHPEGIKGAQSVALAIYLARTGMDKATLRQTISERFGYDLSRTIDEIKPTYKFDVTCQGSVPESIIAFLDSTDYESAIRNAIWLGGDADTMACIAGGIAEAFYQEIPTQFLDEAMRRLPEDFKEIVQAFYGKIGR